MRALTILNQEIVACASCRRLVDYRARVAADKRRQYREWTYWGKPVPGFGDPRARLYVLGLAPAAHGGNRTGRVFTGDRSGDWLYEALHRFGFANQATSVHRDDGLRLSDCYVGATVRCAPPGNKPLPEERDNCAPYLQRELALLHQVRSIVALGSFAWDAALRAMAANGHRLAVKPRFGHGAAVTVGPYRLFGTYHPSQQNTFTGVLTPAMLDAVLAAAKAEALS